MARIVRWYCWLLLELEHIALVVLSHITCVRQEHKSKQRLLLLLLVCKMFAFLQLLIMMMLQKISLYALSYSYHSSYNYADNAACQLCCHFVAIKYPAVASYSFSSKLMAGGMPYRIVASARDAPRSFLFCVCLLDGVN